MTEAIGSLFHTGVIVDDLDQAMELLTKIAGLEWATPRVIGGFMHTPRGALYRESKVTYSTTGPHHVELIQHLDATAWLAAPGGRRVHHLGFWVDDIAEGMDRFAEIGLEADIYATDNEGRPTSPSFHRHEASGLWFELIESSHRQAMEEWFGGAELRIPGDDGADPDVRPRHPINRGSATPS
jgi:catechol 2,3-dioxygenase-like lactoylglutathione lyase family enzyme